MSPLITSLLYILIPLILTVIIEGGFAFLFNFSIKEMLSLLLINCLTNPLFNCFTYFTNLFIHSISIIYIILIFEILIIFIEALLLKQVATKKRNFFIVSLCLNASSFLIGNLLISLTI